MAYIDTYTYSAPTKPLRDYLRLRPWAAAIGGPGATTARLFASVLPGGCSMPAVAFHRAGGGSDSTLDLVSYQWDCYGAQPEDAEALAASLATELASTQPRTLLPGANLFFDGPAVIVDQIYLPVQTSRIPRQVLRTQIVFTAFP